MHACRVEPDEERLFLAICPIDEIHRCLRKLFVNRLHPLLCKRAGIDAFLFAPRPEAWVLSWSFSLGRYALQYASRAKTLLKRWILRIIGVFRLIFGIQMIKVPEEFIEAMNGRQEFVSITQMVLPELPGRIALRFEQFGDGRVLRRQPLFAPGNPTFNSPVRSGLWPVIKAERPAVHDC